MLSNFKVIELFFFYEWTIYDSIFNLDSDIMIILVKYKLSNLVYFYLILAQVIILDFR